MNAAFDRLFERTSQGVDVYVRDASEFEAQFGGSRQPIDEELLEVVEGVDGVAAVAGSVQGYAQFVDKEGEAITPGGAPTLGFNWAPEPLNSLDLRAGGPPLAEDEVVMDANTADSNDFTVGDTVSVITLQEPREFTISGIATIGGEESLGGATLAA
jgi:putative ABC transport system permease protein